MARGITKVNYSHLGWMSKRFDLDDIEDITSLSCTRAENSIVCHVEDARETLTDISKIIESTDDFEKGEHWETLLDAIERATHMGSKKERDNFSFEIDYY